MARHNEFGREGEEVAARYLLNQGYHLLERNWRTGHLEIDLIAEWWGEIVFVEVKSRRNEAFSPAALAVDRDKRDNLLHAARAYLAGRGLFNPFRFDIITVVGECPPYEVKHYKWAFYKA